MRVIPQTCSVSNEDNKRFIPLTGIAQLIDVIFYFVVIRYILCFCAMAVIFEPLSRTTLMIINIMLHRGKIIIVYWLTSTSRSAAENELNHYCVGCHIIITLEHQHCNRYRRHNNCFTSARHDVGTCRYSRYRCTIIIDYNISQFNAK